MNMPLISIIMPVYNAECYLNQGILSCLNQSYQNIELILIDDGSTDKSIE
ncbi:TPA: glycosyltransferase family 2 protein, partial [Haemophilus influenzae]